MRIPGFAYDAKRRRAHFDIYVPGSRGEKRRRKTVEGVTRDEALAKWREFRVESARPEAGAPVTLRRFVDDYYDLISASLRASTIRTQRFIVKNHLLRFFGDTELSDITTIRVVDLKTDMRKRGLSAAYINDAVRLLKTLLRQAVERDVISDYPIKKKVKKEPEQLPQLELDDRERISFLGTFDDEEAFHRHLAARRKLGPVREAAGFSVPRRFGGGMRPTSLAAKAYFARFQELREFFIVALETGLRLWSDLLNLRWRDVNLHDGIVKVETLKTGNDAVVSISTACRAALLRHHAIGSASEFVFVDAAGKRFSATRIRRAFLLAKRLSGIDRRFRPHDLRHTFGCRLASGGVSLQVIAKALGHTTTHMAERYARPSRHAMRAVAIALDAEQPLRAVASNGFASNHSSWRYRSRRTVVLARTLRALTERTRYAARSHSTCQPLSLDFMRSRT